jgi:hypothetical protein
LLSPSSGQDRSLAKIPSGWKAGRRRSTESATSATEDDLRTRLRTLLVHSRSMRARVGRRPAVFRRMTFRSRHAALAREFYKPTSAPISDSVGGDDKLVQSKAKVLRSQLKAMSERKLAAMLNVIDGVRIDDACAAVHCEGTASEGAACAMRGFTQRFTRCGLGFSRKRADRFISKGCRYAVTI